MAHFWLRNDAGEWGIESLAGEFCVAVSGGQILLLTPLASSLGLAEIRFLPPDAAGVSPSWTLLGGRGAPLRVNGQPVALGIRALHDRDEISFARQRCFFSTEELVRIIAFPGLVQPACCPRCKQKVEMGQPAVACPHCRAWHHQSEKFPCWTYEPTCALCQIQATALDAGYSWAPGML
jgi:hypothetical protein